MRSGRFFSLPSAVRKALYVVAVVSLALICAIVAGPAIAQAIDKVAAFKQSIGLPENTKLPPEFPTKDVNARTKDLSTPLHWMSLQGEKDAVTLLLAKGAEVNVKDIHGWTPLHCAALEGHADVVTVLLAKGADISACDEDGATPLDRAVENNGRDVIEAMIAHGIDVNARLHSGSRSTLLHGAAWMGDTKLIETLLAKGAEVNAVDELYETPLHKAAWQKRLAVAELLLAKGADVNATNRHGRTPLAYAVQRNSEDVAKLLLSKGADASIKTTVGKVVLEYANDNTRKRYEQLIAAGTNKGVAPAALNLFEAIKRDDRASIDELLKGGLDVNMKDAQGTPALHYAAISDNTSAIALLLEKGAAIDATDRVGRTALDVALAVDRYSVVEQLLEKGAAFKAEMGPALMHYAAMRDRTRAMVSLAGKGVALDVRNRFGETPLHSAVSCQGCCGEAATFLLDKAVDLNVKDNGGLTPLHLASARGAMNIVKLLVSKGADASILDNGGSDAFYYAATGGHIEVAGALLANKKDMKPEDVVMIARQAIQSGQPKVLELLPALPDINCADSEGRTLMHYAVRSQNKETIAFLMSKGANIRAKDKAGKTPLSEGPDLIVQSAKSARQALDLWQAAVNDGALKMGKSLDPTTSSVISALCTGIKSGQKDVAVADLRSVWSVCEKQGVSNMASVRYGGYVDVGDYKSALAEAQTLKNDKMMADCEAKLQMRKESLEHAMAVMSKNPASELSWWSATLEAVKPSDAEFGDLLSRSCAYGAEPVRAALLVRVKQCAAAGESEKCLSAARLAYEVWPYDDMGAVLDGVGESLRVATLDVNEVNRLITYQQTGPKDGARDPLATAVADLPSVVQTALKERLAKLLPKNDGSNLYDVLVKRGEIYQLLRMHDDACREYRAAFAIAPMGQLKEASLLIPRVLKARDHHLISANAYLSYLRYGSAGPDGQVGTADDLSDPCAGKINSKFPPDMEAALQQIAQYTNADLFQQSQTRGLACLALGDYKQAFAQMKMAYVQAGKDEGKAATATQCLAGAIKAYDGQVSRANQFLMYRKYGEKGPDGKALTDPLPMILKELAI